MVGILLQNIFKWFLKTPFFNDSHGKKYHQDLKTEFSVNFIFKLLFLYLTISVHEQYSKNHEQCGDPDMEFKIEISSKWYVIQILATYHLSKAIEDQCVPFGLSSCSTFRKQTEHDYLSYYTIYFYQFKIHRIVLTVIFSHYSLMTVFPFSHYFVGIWNSVLVKMAK